jgi:hypothetical protein
MQGVRRPSEVQGCEPEQELKDYCCRSAQGWRNSTLRRVWRLPQGVHAKILFEARSCEKLRRSKAFENIEGHRKFVAQADKSREESLVSFVEIIKGKRPMVRNLRGGLAKSR